jgi:putative membrane protein
VARFFVIVKSNQNNKNMISKNLTIKSAALCLGLVLATACGNHETAGDQSKDQADKANEQNLNREGEKDADRLGDLNGMNLYEIKTSENAVTKATQADVKSLASMMVEAHGKMATELQQLASSKGITLPADLTNEQMRDMDKLNDKNGIDFDKEYLDQMKSKHKDVIDKLQSISDKTEDADIKALAQKALPEVRSHLDMIEKTRDQVKDMKDNDGDHHTAGEHNDHNVHH